MQIDFRQSGGFAGMTSGVRLDTASMTASEADELTGLLTTSGLGDPRTSVSPTARDGFVYELTISDGSAARAYVFDDRTLPDGARALVDFLQRRSGPRSV